MTRALIAALLATIALPAARGGGRDARRREDTRRRAPRGRTSINGSASRFRSISRFATRTASRSRWRTTSTTSP